MKIDKYLVNDVNVIKIQSQIEYHESEELRNFLSELKNAEGSKVVFNLSGLKYSNSTILGIFFYYSKEIMSQKGMVCFCCLNPFVMSIFKATQLDRVVKIFSTESEALNAMT
ncbi:MAG: STAS domain-containing protein [Candidatus Wallbacteria bacterium]|nr:STAS domain-containing protein [Candidatus Wallbacteria bacterium]